MILPGTFIADRYEVIDRIGAGGMSDVYKAKDHILGREVAVKILKQEFSEDATFVAKFRTEAQSAAGLEHPNIVNIYDVGSENGTYFIVMEYVEGITLKTYIEKKGQLNSKEAISIAIQVGRGIEAAHLKGIIHRDIKPQNIIISTEGKVKVTDFGIARAATSNTIHADVMGSVHYSSPEQARNGFVDGKSDIYSLGIVMYEMVTGRVPFDGDSTVAIAIQHLQEEMVAPSAYAPELPISLEKIILKATMKSPDRRYVTISDMLMDLKKSLVSPNEDFVTIADAGLEKTRVISLEEQDILSRKAAQVVASEIEAEEINNIDDDYDEDDEEDDSLDKIMTIGGIAVGIAIVVILVVILGNVFGLFGKNANKGVEMDNLVGTTYEEAIKGLYSKGLTDENIEIQYEESSVYADGVIISQSVEDGKKLDTTKDKLIIKVAGKDPKLAESDDSSDDSSDEKTEEEKKKEEESKKEEEAKKEEAAKKEEEAKKEAEKTTVPKLTGLSQADAETAIKNAGLSLTSTSTEYSDSVASGVVISQSIAEGQKVDKKTSITLVISKGKKSTTFLFSYAPNKDCVVVLPDGQEKTMTKDQTIQFTLVDQSTCSITVKYTVPGETVKNDDGTETIKPDEQKSDTVTLNGVAQ